jgi:hypothetical protein
MKILNGNGLVAERRGTEQDLKSAHEYHLRHELLVFHFGRGINPLNHANIPCLTWGNPYCNNFSGVSDSCPL